MMTLKTSRHDTSGNLGHSEKTKSMINKNRRRRQKPGQRHRNYFQQITGKRKQTSIT